MNLLEKYLKVASVYYKDDPVSNSRMILTALNIVISLDKIACDEFPMLLEHHSGLSIEIIQHLLLQRSSDLNYAFTVCDYILTRNNKANYPSLIDYEELFDKNTFAQRYFAENISLQELKIMETFCDRMHSQYGKVAIIRAVMFTVDLIGEEFTKNGKLFRQT